MIEPFINDAMNKAIADYLSSKDNQQGTIYNSFLVVIIRILILIYGELDIINPYMSNDKDLFINNLIKYRYSKDNVDLFLDKINKYYQEEVYNNNRKIKNKNIYFVEIQKILIDMFICKKLYFNITEDETKDFYGLLYTENTKNPLRLSYNYLNATNINEIDIYFKKSMQENVKVVASGEKHVLNPKGYEILGYDITNIINMTSNEIDKINNQVYDFFKIRSNAINKEYLLEKAIAEYEKEKNKITSGNGYVDTLLVLSVIATAIMILSIVIFL